MLICGNGIALQRIQRNAHMKLGSDFHSLSLSSLSLNLNSQTSTIKRENGPLSGNILDCLGVDFEPTEKLKEIKP